MPIKKYPHIKGSSVDRGIYYRLPKFLFENSEFKDLSVEAKVIYAKLLDLDEFSEKAGWYDEEGRVFVRYTLRRVEEFLNCSCHKAQDIFKELGEEGVGLITRVAQGRGAASIIYVHRYDSQTDNRYAFWDNPAVLKK